MKTSDDILAYLRQSRERFAQIYRVQRIGLFGSAARGEMREGSDLDVLVEMSEPTFDSYMDLKFELEDALGVTIDLVLSDTVKERLRPIIAREVVYAWRPVVRRVTTPESLLSRRFWPLTSRRRNMGLLSRILGKRKRPAGPVEWVPHEGLVRRLVAEMESNDFRRQYHAIHAIHASSPITDLRIVHALVGCLRTENSDVRVEATRALGRIGAVAMPPLVDALRDDNWSLEDRVGTIINLLSRMGLNDPEVDTLTQALRQPGMEELHEGVKSFLGGAIFLDR